MVSILTNFWLTFLAGLFAPLGAVCVLPLYPGFLSILANRVSGKDSKKTVIMFGLIIMGGVILSMLIVGLIFSFILKTSLTKTIGIISPIAFGLLGIISIMLIFNFDFSRLFPRFDSPALKNPYFDAFVFGLFFGLIVLPCNPASLTILFALSTSTISFLTNFLNFLFFGIGMGLPLLIIAVISTAKSNAIIKFLALNKRIINLIAGIIMLIISLYYLIFVFKIFG